MNSLEMLAKAWMNGEDCRDQFYDCLVENGYPNAAWWHLRVKSEVCTPKTCILASAVLGIRFRPTDAAVRTLEMEEEDCRHHKELTSHE